MTLSICFNHGFAQRFQSLIYSHFAHSYDFLSFLAPRAQLFSGHGILFSCSYSSDFITRMWHDVWKEDTSQCPLAMVGWEKNCQPCWLNTKFFVLSKTQNEPKMNIFQPAIFEKFWFYDIYFIKEHYYWDIIWRYCELQFHIWALYFHKN